MRITMLSMGMVLLLPLVSAAAPLPTNVPLRVIFVSSTTINGNIGGLVGADAHVQTAANSLASLIPGQPVTAILSVTGTNAPSRFVDGGEAIYNTQGELVANSLSDLFAGAGTGLFNDIQYDEAGNANAGIVWTGTQNDGTLAPTHCSNYTTTSTLQDGRIGRSDQFDGQWTEWGTLNCVNPARLYGLTDVFEETPSVPALGPAALGLLASLLVATTVVRSRRRGH